MKTENLKNNSRSVSDSHSRSVQIIAHLWFDIRILVVTLVEWPSRQYRGYCEQVADG